ncbi:stimulus-sensing domain-containing protein [Magnetospira sp. QH-2]|uniref:stimulus-sensing domain-containing protein n=1 Tax=Magnetospira sp. (strain QH-2) TaxID=1288970 RepID=UPI0003E81AAB|nr:stimulus-sensing domain-containing protein [Magnetospira sp. QH-2]CCQ75074.1 two-component histidine kinase chvG [Magnetospira sp. QH-2]
MTAGDHKRAVGRRRFSPITRRILAVNLLGLVLLVVGMLYLGEYRRALISAELTVLRTHAELFAAALGEGAIVQITPTEQELYPPMARQMVRSMVRNTPTRARLFAPGGELMADSKRLIGGKASIEVEDLPPPPGSEDIGDQALDLSRWLFDWLPGRADLEPYEEHADQRASDYEEVVMALHGEAAMSARALPGPAAVLSVAVPIQRYKHVLGALMVTTDSSRVDRALLEVRLDILKISGLALAITVLLSLYLAASIARPLRLLSRAAERVRSSLARNRTIPDLTKREDEIGDLSHALRDMTTALWTRMDAIERFAADVSHEIKNPLTSLRSAVETVARLEDPEQQRKLMSIIQDDVQRLDRLISDISDASRLDAELSRAEHGTVDLGVMLATLTEIHQTTGEGPRVMLETGNGDFSVPGIESRLVQVFRNLIGNAVSFSPTHGAIRLSLRRDGGWVEAGVADDGPGIPPGKEDSIFDRFYSERPEGEKFGTHSGLGLSISRQIVDAHGGSIMASNRMTPEGDVIGARFVVRLPVDNGNAA